MMLVTGGTGLLGRHLQRDPAIRASWEMIVPGSNALDVRRREHVIEMITDWKPKAVVHLAYRKDDRRCIVDGSRNVAEAAAACGARLIHLSTDVVFGGREAPYRERDLPFAITDYGRMKADAEAAVMAACPSAVMVRTSLMYATDFLAPCQIDVQRSISGAQPMTFFTDEYRCPSHAADVAAACAALAAMPHVSGPLHVAAAQAVSRADFARACATFMGLNPALVPAAPRPHGDTRPGRVVLDSSLAMALGMHCRSLAEAMR